MLNIGEILLWSLIGIMSESLSVYYMNGSFFVSPIEAVIYGCMLCCGPLTAGFCMFITFLLTVAKYDKKYWHFFNTGKRFFVLNFTHHLIIMLILFRALRVIGALAPDLTILPIILLAPFQFTLSCVINTVYYMIEDSEPLGETFRSMFSPYYQTAFPASLAAVIIAMAYPRYGLVSLLFLLTPMIVTLLTMKSQARGIY